LLWKRFKLVLKKERTVKSCSSSRFVLNELNFWCNPYYSLVFFFFLEAKGEFALFSSLTKASFFCLTPTLFFILLVLTNKVINASRNRFRKMEKEYFVLFFVAVFFAPLQLLFSFETITFFETLKVFFFQDLAQMFFLTLCRW